MVAPFRSSMTRLTPADGASQVCPDTPLIMAATDFSLPRSIRVLTADGRIALGGRGIPYRYGSRTDHRGVTQDWTIESLTAVLHDMFPATRDIAIAHAWCGVLGVPRD